MTLNFIPVTGRSQAVLGGNVGDVALVNGRGRPVGILSRQVLLVVARYKETRPGSRATPQG